MDFIYRSQNIFLVIFMMFILGGCVTTKQILSLEKGMTKEEVRSVLGKPGNRQFIENIEVWQYCSIVAHPATLLSLGTMQTTNYVSVKFVDDAVDSISTYSRASHCRYKSINSGTQEVQEKQGNTRTKQQDIKEAIRQERVKQQILNHGAGGCTPDFATGGCL